MRSPLFTGPRAWIYPIIFICRSGRATCRGSSTPARKHLVMRVVSPEGAITIQVPSENLATLLASPYQSLVY
jgi:hypothetical protein